MNASVVRHVKPVGFARERDGTDGMVQLMTTTKAFHAHQTDAKWTQPAQTDANGHRQHKLTQMETTMHR